MIFFQTLRLSGRKHQSGRLYIKHSLQELSELLDQAVLQEDEKQLK
jgi:hypothetical protein